jgi:hypothetical protein
MLKTLSLRGRLSQPRTLEERVARFACLVARMGTRDVHLHERA